MNNMNNSSRAQIKSILSLYDHIKKPEKIHTARPQFGNQITPHQIFEIFDKAVEIRLKNTPKTT